MREYANEPIISVIVPVYRVEKFLPRCISSIAKQTFRDFEMILVDDGSDDACPDICDQAARADARIRVIHQKNQGLSAARNAGIDAARGQYISFVDSDDFIADTMLADMYERVCTDKADMAICNIQYVDEDGQRLENAARKSPITANEVLDKYQALSKLCEANPWYYVVAWNKLYAKHIFDHIRFPVGKRNEDVFIAHEVFWAADRITVLEKRLYYYVQRSGSIMNSKPTDKNLDEAEGCFTCCKFALEHGLDDLAACKYNDAISSIADYIYLLDRSDKQVKAALDSNLHQARLLKKSILNIGGHRSDKLKAIMFSVSPQLYRKVKIGVRRIAKDNTK